MQYHIQSLSKIHRNCDNNIAHSSNPQSNVEVQPHSCTPPVYAGADRNGDKIELIGRSTELCFAQIQYFSVTFLLDVDWGTRRRSHGKDLSHVTEAVFSGIPPLHCTSARFTSSAE